MTDAARTNPEPAAPIAITTREQQLILLKRKAVARENERKQARIDRSREAMGLGAKGRR